MGRALSFVQQMLILNFVCTIIIGFLVSVIALACCKHFEVEVPVLAVLSKSWDVAGMRVGGMMRGAIGRPVLYNPQPQRELISVPVTDQTQNYPTGYKRNRQPAETNSYTPNAEVILSY
jgi:hypothetical protein